MSADDAVTVGEYLELDAAVVEALQVQPFRGTFDDPVPSDPTIYRFYEALDVYGPALKALIHEEFGDGIMSAINFNIDLQRVPHEGGDRVEVETVAEDGRDRRLGPLQVVEHPLPKGAVGAYFPEANVLVPLDSSAEESNTPVYKSVVVRLEPLGINMM